MGSASTSKIRLAILDDYQHLGHKHFAQACPEADIMTFTDTVAPSSPNNISFLAGRLQDFAVISTMRERTAFPADLIRQLPKLKLLLTTAWYNAAIDVEACKQSGVIVAGTEIWEPDKTATWPKPDTTTTHTWAMILGLARHIVRDHASMTEGGWQGPTLATPLSGKTLGLVGLGRLGTAVARIAVMGFGMRVIAWSPNMTQERASLQAQGAGVNPGDFQSVSKEELFRDADVLSVHLVLSDRSRGIIGEQELSLMKRTALFVNTSRGPIVDEQALLKACREGSIGGAALDVFDHEPLPEHSPWRTEKWGTEGRADVLLTPHTGYVQVDVIEGWYKENAANLRRWLDGQEVVSCL